MALLSSDPVPRLLQRLRQELAVDFPPDRPVRIARAPGRLDVMGGIADYTGALVCEAPLDCAAAVAISPRHDRHFQVFSFNLFDEHLPFTFRIPLDALANTSAQALRRDFAEPNRKWAGYLAGCLFMLHEHQYLDLRDPTITGLNLALLSSVPLGAGVSSSAAIEVATMLNLADHFALRPPHSGLSTQHSALPTPPPPLDPLRLAVLCQQAENRVVGAPCGIMDQVTSIAGQAHSLLRLLCQPHELQPPLHLPEQVQVLGINSNVKHSIGGSIYGQTRCAAFMGHKIILQKMRAMGQAAGRQLAGDPMNGYLANLDPDDYKNFFRPNLPVRMIGREFLQQFGPTIDQATAVDPDTEYHIQQATDHHVFEARRVRQFVAFLEQAAHLPYGSPQRVHALNKAGHLMYASHQSYSNNALLGAEECDLLVNLVREYEEVGLYGAKITGGGMGGTVAVLANTNDRVNAAIAQIMQAYQEQTGHKPEALLGTSPGAWHTGTALV